MFRSATDVAERRRRVVVENIANADDSDRLFDMVNYDSMHLQKAIVNRTSDKVHHLLYKEDIILLHRRHKLQHLLEHEEKSLSIELAEKRALEECRVCVERNSKMREWEEMVEREKVMECQKALEREKIARGIQWSKEEELKLRAMQKMQMLEKRNIELENREIDSMWHEVLLSDVREKELKERLEATKRRQEMTERRRLYEEQIASASKRRSDAIREEREKENRRLERMRRKMEQDHAEEIQRKREQQYTNKMNYIEGHEDKVIRLQQQKERDRALDNNTIREALELLRRQREKEWMNMKQLQKDKRVYIENYTRERRMASQLEYEADAVTDEWKREAERQADEYARSEERRKFRSREKSAEAYRDHLEERRKALERERQERVERLQRVRGTATCEIKRHLRAANEELRRQMEYRAGLDHQLVENLKNMNSENEYNEQRQRPFTKRAETFRDMMETKIDKSPGRISTNPIHPFRRLIEDNTVKETILPRLDVQRYMNKTL